MQINNILFDLDGVLIDSKEGIINAAKYSLKKFNIEEKESNLLKIIGPPLDQSFKRFYKDIDTNTAIDYFKKYYSRKGILENRLYIEIKTLITSLKKENKKLAVATSKPEKYAKKILKRLGIDKYFDLIIGSTLDNKDTDKTKIIKKVIDKLSLDIDNTIMIGDRIHDIIGAKNNKIRSIYALWGYGNKKEAIKAKASYIINKIEDIKKILINK